MMNQPSLSALAKSILKETNQDPNRNIVYTKTMGGDTISTNRKSLLELTSETDTKRAGAFVMEALKELLTEGLLEKKLIKNGAIYSITGAGYKVLDSLSEEDIDRCYVSLRSDLYQQIINFKYSMEFEHEIFDKIVELGIEKYQELHNIEN